MIATAMLISAVPTAAIAASPNAQGKGNGLAIQQLCDASFGNFVGAAKKAKDAAHDNYRGGANALVAIAGVHGCPELP